MYLLKKVFQLRDKANPDMEKPFLEHLEDLRIMITRIVLTLVVSMIGCFAFQKQVMDVLRKPVEEVWAVKAAEKLPEGYQVADWEKARDLEQAARSLDESEREAFYRQLSPQELRNIDSVRLVRAALKLEGEARSRFVEETTEGDADLRSQVDTLLARGTDLDDQGGSDLRYMSALKPGEGFMLSMKLSFFSGIVISFPLLFFFILQFVLPGLHDNERRMLWPAMLIGFGLFITGVLFAYFLVLPKALVFFATWDEGLGIGSDWRIGWYISFATQFTLLFGLSFELPVVVMIFVKLGLLSYEMMSRTRSYAVLAIVVAAAMITPTSDVLTLSLMAVPMYVLYELCIWLAYMDERKRRQEEQGRESQDHLTASEDAPLDDTEEGEEEDIGDDDRDDTYRD